MASLTLQKDANTTTKRKKRSAEGEIQYKIDESPRTKRKMLEIECSISLVKETVSYIAINY